jgi:cytochrome c oxidase subunit 2
MKGRLLIGTPAILALAGCSGVQAVLDPAADQAARSKDMWDLMLTVSGIMYLLILIFLGWALWRGRRALEGPPLADGQRSVNDQPLRRTLVAWSVLVVAGLVLLAAGSFLIDRQMALADTRDALKIKITGNQWWWKVEYQDPVAGNEITTANELHLPVNRPARIELDSTDVIHSFWIPNLAGKLDLIPGRTNTLIINARRPGLYRGQCAEFCGLQHAQMALDATVEKPEGFEAWRQHQLAPANMPGDPNRLHGQQVFMGGACKTCHTITGTDAAGKTGPDLTHLASRRSLAAGALPVSRQNLLTWLHDTQAVKPGNHMPVIHMSDSDLNDLVGYLESLT